ncbi:Transposase IS4 [Popillia japonica]|uniref:Transposase IS4 n=1 Tax=Popillia japonica TaxID=7064 RepID=A0AAW1K0S0_POPJA
MRVFLGLAFHMGNVKFPKIQDYWKRDPLHEIKGFSMSMSRNRFILILRALHFTKNPDESQQNNDRLHKIRPGLEYFNNRMLEVYYPGKEQSLDESMVLWRGLLQFRQYIKNKKHKYSIKLYMLTNPDGLVNKVAIYTGMLDEMGGRGHAQKVVLHLLQGKLNEGHHVYMDNYYNSFELARKLLDFKTFCTGTLRLDRKHTLTDVKNAKLKKGETIARYSSGIIIGKWKDKRDVAYISTEFDNQMVDVQNKKKGNNSQTTANNQI